jgi:hypothetical protein
MYVALQGDAGRLLNNTLATRLLFRSDGITPLQSGDFFSNPALASTLSLIASQGIGTFYNGEITTDLLTAVNTDPHNPGNMSRDDLANYVPAERPVAHSTYRGFEVYSSWYPGSGPTLAQYLNTMEGIDIASLPPNSLQALQYFAGAYPCRVCCVRANGRGTSLMGLFASLSSSLCQTLRIWRLLTATLSRAIPISLTIRPLWSPNPMQPLGERSSRR